MVSHNIFSTLFVFPILNLLVAFYKVFLFIKVPGAFGLAIIALTLFIRLLFHPFFKQQIETSQKMQDLKPHLDKLSEKHKKDPKKLQQEQMRLYQEAGINPAAGCLFMLIQLPIFYALYNTFSLFLMNSGSKVIQQINSVLYTPYLKISHIDPWFFGLNLAESPSKAHLWYYYLVPVITGILQYYSVGGTIPQSTTAPANKDDKKGGSDFQSAMNMQMKFIFPFMIALFAYRLPVGLSLYWNIISIFTIIQYRRINAKSKLQKQNAEIENRSK
jgi:YidC/Oxa1 family membrane protein insertase